MKTNALFFQTLKRSLLPLWGLMIVYSFLDHSLTRQMEIALRNPDGISNEVWFFAIASFLVSLIFPLVLLMIGFFHLSRTLGGQHSWGSYLHSYFNLTIIETLRMWGKSLLWSLAFILPGIYRFFTLIFVPYIVCFSKSYQQGQWDALEESKRLVKKYWVRLLGIFLLFNLILPLIITTGTDEYRVLLTTPVQSLLISGLEALIWFIGLFLMFLVFKKSLSEVPHEFNV